MCALCVDDAFPALSQEWKCSEVQEQLLAMALAVRAEESSLSGMPSAELDKARAMFKHITDFAEENAAPILDPIADSLLRWHVLLSYKTASWKHLE